MVVTTDENGKIIAREYIQEELLGEYYRNLVSEDYFDENKERVISLDTLNDRNQIVARKTFKPTISNDDSKGNVVLETVTVDGDQTVYYFNRDSTGK